MDIADLFPTKNDNFSLPGLIANQVFSYSVDTIGNVSFILLLVYLYRIRNDSNNDPHVLIFRQLLVLCGVILLIRDISHVLLWVIAYPNRDMKDKYQTAKVLFFVVFNLFISWFNNFPVTAVLLFSFTAAIQRLVLTYRKEWTVWMTGFPMYCIICVNWAIAVFHMVLLRMGTISFLSANDFDPSLPIIIFEGIFLSFAITSSAIYYHFYRLISTFTDQYEYHRVHLLYQFVPIHTLLTIYSSIQFLIMVFGHFEYDPDLLNALNLNLEKIVTPLIPTVVALSYILSRENIRSVLLAVLGPIWVELSG